MVVAGDGKSWLVLVGGCWWYMAVDGGRLWFIVVCGG